ERWTMASFGLVFPTLIGWVLAGWLLVAMPLGAAFSRHSTWLTVLAQIAWLAGAPLLGRFLAKRARARALTRWSGSASRRPRGRRTPCLRSRACRLHGIWPRCRAAPDPPTRSPRP